MSVSPISRHPDVVSAVLKLKPSVFVVGFSTEVFRGNVMIHGNVSLIYNEGRSVVESLQNCILFVRSFLHTNRHLQTCYDQS